MSATAYKAVDADLGSYFYYGDADPLTYTPGADLVAEGLPGTSITDAANVYRGIFGVPTLEEAARLAVPTRGPVSFRFVELSYDLADVLGEGTAATGGRFGIGWLSLKAAHVAAEVFP